MVIHYKKTPRGRLEEVATLAERDDAELLERVARGDRAAFRVLYERYYRRLFRFINRMTRQADLTEEALNDAMLVVWQSAGSFAARSRVSTWLLGIAYRRALKIMEKDRIRSQRFAPEAISNEPEVPGREPTNQEILHEWLDAGLERLSPDHRAVIELTYYHGYSYQEIAEIMGCPTNTVKTRMYHARANLKKWLPFLDGTRGSKRIET